MEEWIDTMTGRTEVTQVLCKSSLQNMAFHLRADKNVTLCSSVPVPKRLKRGSSG